MMELIHKILLWIHIPVGLTCLILFWIPVGLKKGSPLHRKVGRYYFIGMWGVLVTAFLLSICNTIEGNYMSALYLGYLSIITAYPLWYANEILQQGKEWSPLYYKLRKGFLAALFISGVGMFLLGGIKYQFQGMGVLMAFFGLLAFPAGREFLMTKEKAMAKETKIKMHIQGTIISGIAAYTAFLAFGGRRLLIDVLHMDTQWMVIPWVLPTLLGITYSRYMKRKYQVAR
jgi:uncharacterized membrane protein